MSSSSSLLAFTLTQPGRLEKTKKYSATEPIDTSTKNSASSSLRTKKLPSLAMTSTMLWAIFFSSAILPASDNGSTGCCCGCGDNGGGACGGCILLYCSDQSTPNGGSGGGSGGSGGGSGGSGGGSGGHDFGAASRLLMFRAQAAIACAVLSAPTSLRRK